MSNSVVKLPFSSFGFLNTKKIGYISINQQMLKWQFVLATTFCSTDGLIVVIQMTLLSENGNHKCTHRNEVKLPFLFSSWTLPPSRMKTINKQYSVCY